MNVINKGINEITPYENNPRKNDEAVDYVAASIKEFGFKVPIVIDKDGIIVAGHTRYKAAKKLHISEVPCVVADDLTDEQVKAFRLADNRVGEIAEWDDELLGIELDGIAMDMGQFGFDPVWDEVEEESKYTHKIKIPHYDITGEMPLVSELVDAEKYIELVEEIKASDIDSGLKEFLIMAASRHLKFNYNKIAEFYAHQNKDVQRLFERSALVIIDFDDAIANGYVALSEKISEIYREEYPDGP